MYILKYINHFIIIAIFYSIYCFNSSSAQTGPKHGKLVVCYLRSWAVYQPSGGSFAIEDVDPNLCTHIVYAFVGLNSTNNSIRSRDRWQDLAVNYGKDGFNRLTSLRKKYPHLKVSVAIGGWGEGSSNYSNLVANPERRTQFVTNAVDFLKKYNFDGLNFDWIYPGIRGGSPNDKENFVLLIKELKEEFNKTKYFLTASFSAKKYEIKTAYDVANLSKYLDYVHLNSFQYNGIWDLKTGINAPLHSKDGANVESSVAYLLTLGMEPSKLILGLPLFGHTFYTEKPAVISNEGINNDILVHTVSKQDGPQGPYTKQNGFMGYNEICLLLKNSTAGWKKYWDNSTMTPIAVLDNIFISFDDENSLKEKIKFALKEKLGGFMISYLDTDDFHGDCSEDPSNNDNRFPLSRAINKEIEQILANTKEEEIKKNVTTEFNNILVNTEEIDTPITKANEKNSVSNINHNILIFAYTFIILYYLY